MQAHLFSGKDGGYTAMELQLTPVGWVLPCMRVPGQLLVLEKRDWQSHGRLLPHFNGHFRWVLPPRALSLILRFASCPYQQH